MKNWRTIQSRLFCAMATTAALALTLQARGAIRPDALRCEYLPNPLAVEDAHPHLSWVLKPDPPGSPAQRGVLQSACRILVATSPQRLAADEGDLWDSGKLSSAQSVQVAYAGKPLSSRLRCYWKVRVFDQAGKESP